VSAADETRTDLVVREGDRVFVRAAKVSIEVLSGPNAGQATELSGDEIRIGSGRGNHLVLLDSTVSRHHATLRLDRAGIRVVDAGSSNGTRLDGARIRDAWARSGSTLECGTTTLRLGLLQSYVEVPVSAREQVGGLLGRSAVMRRVFTLLERVAATDDPVLIEGETGTGKELVAEAIHEESPRSGEPFVVFDCSAVSPSLLESELFGHVRGAFSGAVSDREGVFEAADGGTLFLDEIGELPLELQPKLLRALERLEVRRVGANLPRRVDVRLVAATNRHLQNEVAKGRFREDLYYRIAVVTVHVPPLRERGGDVALLAEHFAREMAGREGRLAGLPPKVLVALAQQAWPGNVRELRNAVSRAMSGIEGTPTTAPPGARAPAPVNVDVPFHEARDRLLEEFEVAYFSEALRRTGGNATKAAELTGVNRKFIQRAIQRHKLRGRSGE
jgi:transcriptional regulator with GAF, ATPase, and Fis domain